MNMACSFFTQHADHERAEAEAEAQSNHEAAEAERKRVNLHAALKHGTDELGEPVYITLLDLASDFAGDSGLAGVFAARGRAADQFLTAACRAIYAQAQAGNKDAQQALDGLTDFFVRNGQ